MQDTRKILEEQDEPSYYLYSNFEDESEVDQPGTNKNSLTVSP
jgi:hypothetical protein